jgi:putative MATE family efflux protein
VFIASIFLSFIGITFSEEIFRLIKLPGDILPQATTYLNIYIGGLVMVFGFNGTSAILRGLGDSKTPLVFLIISTLFNIGFDLLFVLVFNWGIAGVAIATIIAQGGAFITAILYLNKNHDMFNIKLTSLTFDKKIFRQSLRIGLPTGFQHTFFALGIMVLMGIVNTFGTNVIAAYSAAVRIDSLAALPAMNFSQALATFVGQNIGAKKTQRVRSGMISTFFMSSIISITVTLVVILSSRFLMGLFTDDKAVISIGAEYLIIVSSFYLVFTGMFTVNGVLRGAGDTLVPMFITLFSLWLVRLPVAYFLSREIGETGIWWSSPTGWVMGLILSYIYFSTGKWKTKSVIKK